MLGFSFAIAPLYNKLCNYVDFYNGVRTLATKPPELDRDIKIEFVTQNNQNLNWDFYPRTINLATHPNENMRIVFFAKNKTSHKMTVQAIPSFTPAIAAKHFHKTECFCFSQQTLEPGQAINMPMIFHVDEDLPKDIPTITLSYTLFDVTHKPTSRKIS
jgi:cytochrome c oxidase assembly protein subunit 11